MESKRMQKRWHIGTVGSSSQLLGTKKIKSYRGLRDYPMNYLNFKEGTLIFRKKMSTLLE